MHTYTTYITFRCHCHSPTIGDAERLYRSYSANMTTILIALQF